MIDTTKLKDIIRDIDDAGDDAAALHRCAHENS